MTDCLPHLIRAGGGAIVNVGSANAYVGGANLFAYSVSKGGLITMTRNLARAHAGERIRVNYVSPGWVITETEIEVQAKEGHDREWLAQAGAVEPTEPQPDHLHLVFDLGGRELRLRGLNARVVRPGIIRAGDVVRKMS